MLEPEPTCGNCGRPLRAGLRGFCPGCVTTPKQRERLARSAGAIKSDGPVARAFDLIGGALVILVAIAVVVAVYAWLGLPAATIALAVLIVTAFTAAG